MSDAADTVDLDKIIGVVDVLGRIAVMGADDRRRVENRRRVVSAVVHGEGSVPISTAHAVPQGQRAGQCG